MRTLADMTPEERANCRGMWCDTPKGRFILLAPMFPDCEAFGWELLIPSAGMKIDYLPEKVTPLPDLPRAWNPDGTPIKGGWTEAEYIGDSHGMRDVYHFDGTPTHRYFETEWEEIPNA